MLKGLQAKLALVGAAILAALAAWGRMRWLKEKASRAEVASKRMEATLLAERVKKEVIKEEKKKEYSRRAVLLKELKKDDKDFKGLDNLSDSNKR